MELLVTLITSSSSGMDEKMQKEWFLSSSVLVGSLWHSLKVKECTEVGGEFL